MFNMLDESDNKKEYTLEIVIDALLNENEPFPDDFLPFFSDISPKNMEGIKASWPKIKTERKVHLINALEKYSDENFTVLFDEIGKFALKDPDNAVIAVAIQLLKECQETDLIPIYIDLLENNENETVKSNAANALGLFIYLGELEEIPIKQFKQVKKTLLDHYHKTTNESLQQTLLEALSYSGNEEITDLIQVAFEKDKKEWVASALKAMGRSADKRWEKQVISKLNDKSAIIQLEAIRASGNLETPKARIPLIEKIEKDDFYDEEAKLSAIIALSNIGGDDVQETLIAVLEDTDDEDEILLIEEALEFLEFTERFEQFDLLEFDLPDENEETEDF